MNRKSSLKSYFHLIVVVLVEIDKKKAVSRNKEKEGKKTFEPTNARLSVGRAVGFGSSNT